MEKIKRQRWIRKTKRHIDDPEGDGSSLIEEGEANEQVQVSLEMLAAEFEYFIKEMYDKRTEES